MVSNTKLDTNSEYNNINPHVYGLINTLSISLLSNLGIKTKLDMNFVEESSESIRKRLKINNEALLNMNELEWLKNINPILGVYSSDIDKTITLKNQALLIISELNLAEDLLANYFLDEYKFEKDLLSMILIDLAVSQINFTILGFKTDDGFLRNNKEATISSFDELSFFFYALSKLHKIMLKNKIQHKLNYDKSNVIQLRNSILEDLSSNEDKILLMDTNKLTDIVSCVSKGCEAEDIPLGNYLSINLGEELISRCIGNGYINSNKLDNEISSLATHFKAINSLLDSYKSCKFNIFLESALEIYNNVDNLWDNEVTLFVIKNRDVIKYNSKNIGIIFSALKKIRSLIDTQSEKEKLQVQSNEFLNNVLNRIGVQIMPNNPDLSIDSSGSIRLKSFSSLFQKNTIAYPHKGFKMYYSDKEVELDMKNLIEYTLILSNSLLEN